MSFLGRVAKIFGMISVKTRGNQVIISGIDAFVMQRYIRDIFETDVFTKMMFTSITDTSVTFNQFFVPDVVYMLRRFKDHPKCNWSTKGTLDKIVHLIEQNTWYKVTTLEHKSVVDLKRLKLLKWKPLPKQLEFLSLYGDKLPKYDLRGYLLAAGAGTGKAQPYDSKILTPTGWDYMGDMAPGKQVFAPDGTICTVKSVHPQGVRPVYKVRLESGRQTRCDLDHLWSVSSDAFGNQTSLLTLRELLASSDTYYVPVIAPGGFTKRYECIESILFDTWEHTQCISIDHPEHLYITDDYIVTHNTFTDLMVATCIIPPEVAEVKIIISPKKALHLVWEKTIRAVFYKQPTYWCSDSPRPMPLSDNEYYIFNFEQIEKAIDLGKSLSVRGIKFFVIVDESHNFADYKSNRTQRLVKLQTLVDETYFIWASGTPILKSAAELSSYLRCADRRFDDDAERRFRRIFSGAPGRAAEIFNHRLGQMMAFLVAKTDVNPIKPTIRQVPVRLPPNVAKPFLMSSVREEMRAFILERLKFYEKDMKRLRVIVNTWLDYHEKTLTTKQDRKEFYQYLRNIKELSRNMDVMLVDISAAAKRYERIKLFPTIPPTKRKEFRSALSAIKNIKQKVRGEALGTILSKRRAECAATLGLYCQPERIIKESASKTLFFASSVLAVKELGKYLTDAGFSPVLVYAETNSQLTQMMNAFDVDPSLNPAIATMQSLSEAVPVTAASTVVFLNRPFRDALAQQVIARADRLGQKHKVTVLEITLDTGSEPNVSSTTDAILSDVRSMISQLIGPEFISYNEADRIEDDVIIHTNAKLLPNMEVEDL